MNEGYRLNERINAPMVRLIVGEGEHQGIVPLEEAMQIAAEKGMDLVEIAPEAEPPVCKLLDYGKFKYRRNKRLHQKHHGSQLKEIWIGPKTEGHDLDFKAGRVRQFLGERHKVRITMRLKGRYKAHGTIALETLRTFGERFVELAKFEVAPMRENAERLSMLLSPK